MKSASLNFQLKEILSIRNYKVEFIIVLSTVLVAIHRYFGSIEFGAELSSTDSFFSVSYMFASAFIIFGLIPLFVIVFILGEDPKKYGLSTGKWKIGAGAVILLFPPIAALLLYPAANTEEMRFYYPFDKLALSSLPQFIQLQFWRVILFYTAWEFFFRGFILFGLRDKLGDTASICIQTIPSCLWHIGAPTGELFSSIAGGIMFGYLALKTDSILWPFVLHCLIGVCLDFFIVYQVN